MSSVPENPQPVSSSTAAQHLWDSAVCLASTRARAALPHSNGRVDKAMQLVLDGAVELLDDHSARVTSQRACPGDPSRDGETQYYVVNGACQCRDFPNAPQGACKHRISRWILLRALQLAKELGDTPAHAAASSTQPSIPPEFIVQIQGKQFVLFSGLLTLATQQGLLSLTEEFTHVTESYVLAQARAEFHDGRVFRGAADATPDNVGKQVKPHWRRMALTRAKARCLRDALNINLVTVEELD